MLTFSCSLLSKGSLLSSSSHILFNLSIVQEVKAMGLFRAIFQLIKAGAVLSLNSVRLVCSSLAVPLLKLAERIGKVAASAEQSAKEYEKKLEEQEAKLK